LIGGLFLGAAFSCVQWVRVQKRGISPMNFLRYAITLEAQQVPLYERLCTEAEYRGQAHVAAGLAKAMLVEEEHHNSLKQEASRLGVASGPWSILGTGLGYVSGAVLAKLPTATALKTIIFIETKAAKDYRQAGSKLDDDRLRRLYLDHQVDEEIHYSWAREMLKQYW